MKDFADQFFLLYDKDARIGKRTHLTDEDLKQSGLYKEGAQKSDPKLRDRSRFADFGNGFIDAFQKHMLDDYKHSFSPMGASNCWAVSGKFTESGKPMLSSDPHLANSIPALWYLISLESADGQFKGTGASFYGYPGLGIGRTPHSTWGVSNTKVDNIDLYLEQIEGDKYFHDNEWKAMEVRTEVFNVRFGDPVEFKVYSTHHGPVFRGIEDYSKLHFLIPGLVPVSLENISFAWAHLQVHDSSTEVAYKLAKAKTGAEVLKLLDDPKGLMVSYIWAGANGDILNASPGAYPVR